MAVFWTFLATFLFANCVVSARNYGERTFQKINANDESGDIAKYRVEKDENTLERRGFRRSGCQMGTTGQGCWPNLCGSKTYHLHFPQPFSKKPSVSVSFSTLDVDKNYNIRVSCYAKDITTTSFNVRFSTWSTTRIYGVGISWIACV
ncbi:uncharacterized protein LOC114519150 [Dendronephthya gigantea]|uniref:uncharacterized protein LOC114519150 n=1 Tax=Dendronephthya gigantea TaxID=151771 RepID=UPI0010698081|nr:uncharacterized protein LOC114519150 [Dendronephthya gigantea]